MRIRPATPADTDLILELIMELAIYEKTPEEAVASASQINEHFFGSNPMVFCDIVEEDDGVAAGFAVWFLNYSTWQGKPGLYLEDLFVRPEHRKKGYGKALLKYLAKKCIDNGYGRFQWWVLDWNQSAIDFYESLGAVAMDEWTVMRVSGDALKKLAE